MNRSNVNIWQESNTPHLEDVTGGGSCIQVLIITINQDAPDIPFQLAQVALLRSNLAVLPVYLPNPECFAAEMCQLDSYL